MAAASFGPFAQRMFDAGLVFNIQFTDEELAQLPRWSIFDHKIMDQIATLSSRPELPPRPPNTPISANATLWTFIKCHTQNKRNSPGRPLIHLNPPADPITPSMYTLQNLANKLGMLNPISPPDDTPLAKKLVIIGKLFTYCYNEYSDLAFEAPRFPGFVTGLLSSINGVVNIPARVCRFGSHACFGYRLLEDSFNTLGEILHSVTELCGTGDIPCPALSPRSSPNQDCVSLPSVGHGGGPVVTVEDYLDSDEQFEQLLSKLRREEEKRTASGGLTVISCCFASLLLLIFQYQAFSKPVKRVRVSPRSSEELPLVCIDRPHLAFSLIN